MKKLKLDPDALRVETFEAQRAPEPRGTVQAHASSGDGGIFECANQCFSIVSAMNCPSQHCSAWECNSLSGCVSYEDINCSRDC